MTNTNVTGIDNLRYEMCQNLSLTENVSDIAFCINNSIPDPVSDSEFGHMQRMVTIVVIFLFSIIVIVGLIGNSMVVIVVAFNQQMRSTTNLLIINLAVADLLFIIFCVPFTATDYVLPFWPFGDLWCKGVQYLIVVTAYASVYTLVLMSLDRFLAVVHPIASMYVRTEKNANTAIVIIWAVILILAVPVLYRHGEVTYTYSSKEHTVCVFLDQDPISRPDGYSQPVYQIFFFLTSYAIPLALICGLYLFMLMRLWKGVAPGGHVSAESKRGKKRVTRMVVIVVTVFAICWFPIQIILLLKSVDYYEITTFKVMLQIGSQVLAYMNSCLNPILYAFLSENFRKAFRKVIYCGPDPNLQHRLANGRQEDRSVNQTRTTRINNDIV
ncbi:allatostatin-A receptor-like [Planococcus citri]|uniref:allatostatin-A receptor-like n=1 Tax=Planococcus citri TaxID=170843 RepID=UPI0031F9C729